MHLTVVDLGREMTPAEARDMTDRIKGNLTSARQLLLEMYERRGWEALGYPSWREYGQVEFGYSETRVYELMNAAKTERNISAIAEKQIPEGHLRPLTRLEPDQQIAAWQEVIDTAPNGKVTGTYVAEVVGRRSGATPYNNHAVSNDPDYDGDEWFTPAEYIEAARRVMGGIDLDPASSDEAQVIIRAGIHYTKADNGLARPWFGRVWLNPPYSTPLVKDFVMTVIDEYESGRVSSAIVLTNNSSDTSWFHALLAMYPACFTRGRISFWRPGQSTFAARQGQVFFYLGDNAQSFANAFDQFGLVVRRWDNDN